MVITNDKGLYERSDWYHDHGHDHNPNVGRALEGRTILGFNFRMNEFQGAVGLAQLRKLDYIIGEQRKNKAAIKDALGDVPGIGFRKLFDPDGDTATFLGFNLPDEASAKKIQGALKEEGVDTIYFKDNAWVDSDYTADQKLIKVKRFSEAYFQISRALPKTNQYLALGTDVIVNIGNQSFQIGEEGKTRFTQEELMKFF